MNTRSAEQSMIEQADKISAIFSEYYFLDGAENNYGDEVPFVILSFGMVACFYEDMSHIGTKEKELFMDRAADYIVVEIMKTKRISIAITTPEYRNFLKIVRGLIASAESATDDCLISYPDNSEETYEFIIENLGYFMDEFNDLAERLKVAKINELKSEFMRGKYVFLINEFQKLQEA